MANHKLPVMPTKVIPTKVMLTKPLQTMPTKWTRRMKVPSPIKLNPPTQTKARSFNSGGREMIAD